MISPDQGPRGALPQPKTGGCGVTPRLRQLTALSQEHRAFLPGEGHVLWSLRVVLWVEERPNAESWRHSSKLVATARAGPSEMAPLPPPAEPGSQEVTAQGAARPCFLWDPMETQEGLTSLLPTGPFLLPLLLEESHGGANLRGERRAFLIQSLRAHVSREWKQEKAGRQ